MPFYILHRQPPLRPLLCLLLGSWLLQLSLGIGNVLLQLPLALALAHNAGAMLVEQLARQHGVSLSPESKFFGLTARLQLGGQDLRLLVPATFMNRSGQAVLAMASFYRIGLDELLIAHDELDLPVGSFAVGQKFDAMLLDPDAADGTVRRFGETDPLALLEKLLYTASRPNIRTVWVDGRPIGGAA